MTPTQTTQAKTVRTTFAWHFLLINMSDDHSALTWKNFVWNLVKAQPIRRSSSCRASTLRASFSFGFPRLARAALISFSVIAEKWARNTTYKKSTKYLGKEVTLQNFICKSSFSLCSFDSHKSAFTHFINLGMPSICTSQKTHIHPVCNKPSEQNTLNPGNSI